MRAAFLAVLLLALPAAAYEEADAPSVDARIERVWHEPAVPAPGQQWNGFIRFHEGHNVTDVRYQICRVGHVCFAGPTLATQLDANTWVFDTADYKAGRNPVDWGRNYPGDQPGDWRVGVQYLLFTDGEGTDFGNATLVPHGVDLDNPRCDDGGDLGWMGCSETHYFAFDLPAQSVQDEKAPAPTLWLWALAVGAVLLVRRR